MENPKKKDNKRERQRTSKLGRYLRNNFIFCYRVKQLISSRDEPPQHLSEYYICDDQYFPELNYTTCQVLEKKDCDMQTHPT
jgi:hypothetical protein